MSTANHWASVFERSLPEITRQAGAGVLRDLARTLSRRTAVDDVSALLAELDERLTAFADERSRARLVRETLRVADGQEQRRTALREAVDLLAARGARRGDRRALRRDLDEEALQDRLLRRVHDTRQPVEFLCRVLAAMNVSVSEATRLRSVRQRLLELGQDESQLWTLREAALYGVGACCTGDGDARERQGLLSLAVDARSDPWVQSAALGAWSGCTQDDVRVAEILGQVLVERHDDAHPDHFLFRARALRLAIRREVWPIVAWVAEHDDPSEHVRMAVVSGLAASPIQADTRRLIGLVRGREPSPQVRAAGALAAIDLGAHPRVGIRLIREALRGSEEMVSIVLSGLVYRQRPGLLGSAVAHERFEAWAPSLDKWIQDPDVSPDTRTDAAAVALGLHNAGDPARASVWDQVTRWAEDASEGAELTIRTALDQEAMLQVLAVVALSTRDLSATPVPGGYQIQHGTVPTPAIWRLLYEIMHPRTDKRQAISHIIDRVPRGPLLAPAGGMAEVTPTAVPGRPVCTPTSRWWHPDLPLPSWAAAAARRGRLEVFALPDVRMTVTPRRATSRLGAAQARYVRLARERDQASAGPASERVERYDRAMSRAGFRVRRHRQRAEAVVPALPLLPALAADAWSVFRDPVGTVEALWTAIPGARELLALDGNSLPQLGVFTAVLGAGWATTAGLRRRWDTRARRRLPLVIGGWGSRGKSGVERLKAAVFQELGYSVLSKTTGNEAMMVMGLPGRDPVEVFLYRPYDRASIVEQREVLHLADRMGVQVLLWECMALNPRYVSILQREWMRDDLTTITNTYPDHEDIQGPSGIDVAQVIAEVLPYNARAITTEQSMTPILAERARLRGTRLDALTPEAWQLLPPDLLARFPYQEHPRNIALVVALARTLGVPSDVALRAMADSVVPDLGVLKEYGPIQIDNKKVSYIVGNSANERAGFLSNWVRVGFDGSGADAGLLERRVLVVNNRRDRVPRQTIFAKVAAVDAPVDLLVVIGTNVSPFVHAWRKALETDLKPRWMARLGDPSELARVMSDRLRRPLLSRPQAEGAVRRLLPGADGVVGRVAKIFDAAAVDRPPAPRTPSRDLDATIDGWLAEVAWLQQVRKHRGVVPASVVQAGLAMISAQVLVLSDANIKGTAITQRIVEVHAEGSEVRILGAANIKGTGLDLVYKWVQVDRVKSLLTDALEREPARATRALRSLRAIELSALDKGEILSRLEGRVEDFADNEQRLDAEALLQSARAASGPAGRSSWASSPLGQVWKVIRTNFDIGAVTRRNRADQLIADLGHRRIGLSRAAAVARDVVERQKA
ncbi:MAG: hypothetical protein AB8H79_11345 [Myxococcota bacterium]